MDPIHLYGHSHVRRLGELLENPARLAHWNQGRREAMGCNTKPLLPNFGLGVDCEFHAEGRATIAQLTKILERNKRKPRAAQAIFIDDNERNRQPSPSPARVAEEIIGLVEKHTASTHGLTYVPGLLPRWGEEDYCQWASDVNEQLLDLIEVSPQNRERRRIFFLRHNGLLRLPHPKRKTGELSNYDITQVHGEQPLRQRRDNWHMEGEGMAQLYSAIRFALIKDQKRRQ